MADCAMQCRPRRLAGEDPERGGGRLVEQRGARELVVDTTSARRSQRRPRSVMSSGSPGPAPTSTTRPLRHRGAPAAGALAASAARPAATSRFSSPSRASRQPLGVDARRRRSRSARRTSATTSVSAAQSAGKQRLELLAHEPGHGRARAAGGHGHRAAAPAEHGGQDEVAARRIVGAVDPDAALPRLGGDRAVHGAVVGGHHDEREARRRRPRRTHAATTEPRRRSPASMSAGESRAHHGDAGARVDEPRDLPLGDRPAADDEARAAREIEHHRDTRNALTSRLARLRRRRRAARRRGKKRTRRSSTSGSSSHGTSSRIRCPRPRIGAAAAADEDVDAVDDLAVHLDLAALEPDVGGVVIAARGGTAGPAHGERARLPRRASRTRGRAPCARVLVSISARLQKSVPVHETRPRSTSDGLYGSSLSSGSSVRSPSRASGTCGMQHVLRRREAQLAAAVALGSRASSRSWSPVTRPDRRLEPDVVQPRLALAEDADVIVRGCAARVAARGRQRPARGAPRAPCGSAPRPTRRSGRPAATCCATRAGRDRGRSARSPRRPPPRPPGRTKASSGLANTGPPDPCLPPTATLKPAISLAVERRRSPASSRCPGSRRRVQCSGQPGDRDVELARQVGEGLVADEDPLELARDRRGVEELASG